jgi:hypothetical protein
LTYNRLSSYCRQQRRQNAVPTAAKRDCEPLTPAVFMSELDERLADLTLLPVAIRDSVDRLHYPPVNALVSALKESRIISAELAEELLDAIPLLSRAIAGKSEFNEEAHEWAASHGRAVLAALKETYQRTIHSKA